MIDKSSIIKKTRTGSYYVREYAAVLLLIIGCALSYVFISVGFWSIVGPLIGVTVGSLLAVLWVFHSKSRNPTIPQLSNLDPLPKQIPIIIGSLFVVSILLGLRPYTHTRPVFQYLAFGGYAGFIGYEIARGASRKRVLPQICVLAFFTYWSSQILFPTGMYAADTYYDYLPAINEMYSTGQIPESQRRYGGHLAHTTLFSILTGMPAKISYYLLATLLLVSTIPLISIIDRVLPVISKKIALYAALVFSISSWMLGRGMHPNKLNYFYALIILLGMVAFLIYTERNGSKSQRRWSIVGFMSMPALIYGHRFSAGAAMVFLLAIAVFILVIEYLPLHTEHKGKTVVAVSFVSIYILSIIGSPLHQQPLLGRISNLFLSVILTSAPGGGGGPGRYSELSLNVLFISTAAQTLLFALAILGAIWIFRQNKWEYDMIIFWMGCVSLLLVVSLLRNSVDTAPQRFYALLVLFGFNICVGAFLYVIDQRGLVQSQYITISGGRTTVTVLIVILAMTSLASPVADTVMSPAGDEIPHFQQFETEQRIAGEVWGDMNADEPIIIVPPSHNAPIEQTSTQYGTVDRSAINHGAIMIYSNISIKTGVGVDDGYTLGGRSFVFVPSPEKPTDNRIYTNGEIISFQVLSS